jgi:hypothetical protein
VKNASKAHKLRLILSQEDCDKKKGAVKNEIFNKVERAKLVLYDPDCEHEEGWPDRRTI